MYLSRARLNLHNKAARQDLANPYDMHRTLSRVFTQEDNKPEKILWRLDTASGKQPVLLVTSTNPGTWDTLLQADYCSNTEFMPLTQPEQLTTGRILRFRLKANPTVTKVNDKRSTPQKRVTQRLGLENLEEQLEWFERQAVAHGFKALGVMVSKSQKEQYRKAESILTLQTVVFDGHLKISDAEKFYQALIQGIGHGKRLGLGMLSIKNL